MLSRPVAGWLLAGFAILALIVAFCERFAPANQTTFGVALSPHGSNAVVRTVAPRTPAALVLRPGDTIELTQMPLATRLRLVTEFSPPGTVLNVPVLRDGKRSLVTVRAVPLRGNGAMIRFDGSDAVFLSTATLTLLILGFIGLRRPLIATLALVYYGVDSLTAYRLAGLLSPLPDSMYGPLAALAMGFIGFIPTLALLPFVVRFTGSPAPAPKHVVRAGDAIFLLGAAALFVQPFREPMDAASWRAVDTWVPLGIFLLVLAFAGIVYQNTAGEARRRISWVIGGIAVSAMAITAYDLVVTVFSFNLNPNVVLAVSNVSQLAQCALPLALAYAILRHRVLDIGFALNRTAVYVVMTTLVVGVVSFADWLSSRLLSQQRLALAVEALITISFGFALNWIHGRTERVIDRVVFRQRHIAEKRIEYRIDALDYAASAHVVDEALATDAAAILGLSSAAVFRRLSSTVPFRRAASVAWPDSSTMLIDPDSTLVRTLRALEKPFFLDDAAIAADGFPAGAAHPILVVPILTRHELTGFVLYGNRRDGASPDPEEVSLVSRLAAAAGTAYASVEARQWRERASALEDSLRGFSAPPLPS